MSKTRAVGIDLGTTYSCVAYLDDKGHTQVVRNSEGDLLTPSVVLFEDNEVIVGKEAKKAAAVRSGAVADFVKRDMGKEHYSKPIHGEKLHPEVIQACILKKLKDDTAAQLGAGFEAVITVPAYFDEPRRKATADAGEMAGLNVLDIVNEPTAAALSFGESLGYLTAEGEPREPMKVMVYDLGGGTFDVTLLDLRPGDLRTLATDGDVQLGGYDWDMRLVNFAAEEFQKKYHLDPRQSPAALASVLAAAEECKQSLTARPKSNLTVRHGGHSLELVITREQFEELSEDLLERTSYTSRQVLAAAGLKWTDVNRVLLVGGSTRMPMVSRMIEQLTGLTPDHTVHPDEAVARGAAVFAGYLIRHRDPNAKPTFKVVDVNSHSLGIEGIDQRTHRKENIVIIPRNSPLPAKVTEKFVTKAADQASIVVKVLEGESKVPAQCSAIGKAVLRNLPEHLPKGWPVEVTYEYLTNGRLDVRAKIPGTSKGVELELQREAALTSENIGKWKKVVTEAQGFDAFEGMLDDVIHAHRVEKKAESKAAKNWNDPLPEEAELTGRDLSAASRAFSQVVGSPESKISPPRTRPSDDDDDDDDDDSPPSRLPGEGAVASPAKSAPAKPAPTGPSGSGGGKMGSAAPLPSEPTAKSAPGGVSPAAAKSAVAGAPIGGRRPIPMAEPQPSQTRGRSNRRVPMWLLNGAGLLIFSAVTLIACYYVLCIATRKGEDFMNFGLPFLKPAAHAPAH